MYFVYGGYTHPDFEVNLEKFERFVNYTERGNRRSVTHRMTITGELQYSSQGALTTAINELEDAYENDGQGDFGLVQDDGSPTPHFLYNATSLFGVRVKFFTYPRGDAAEYATKRTFAIVAEAEYANPGDLIVAFEETLSYLSTGGPRFDIYPTAKGPPLKVLICQRTPQQIVQTGRIVGLLDYVPTPGPIFPAYEHVDRRQAAPGSPRKYGKYFLDYPIAYSYHFTLPAAANALPNNF